jgi:hypothetical protein
MDDCRGLDRSRFLMMNEAIAVDRTIIDRYPHHGKLQQCATPAFTTAMTARHGSKAVRSHSHPTPLLHPRRPSMYHDRKMLTK